MIKLSELLDKIDKYENIEITKEELQEFFKNIEIKNYLPISQKRSLFKEVFDYLNNYDFKGDIIQQSLITEVIFKLMVVFNYTNIHKPKNLDEVLYNNIAKTGLLEFILSSIGYDYIELKESFDRLFQHMSLYSLKNIMEPDELNQLRDMCNGITSALKEGKGLETLKKLVNVK